MHTDTDTLTLWLSWKVSVSSHRLCLQCIPSLVVGRPGAAALTVGELCCGRLWAVKSPILGRGWSQAMPASRSRGEQAGESRWSLGCGGCPYLLQDWGGSSTWEGSPRNQSSETLMLGSLRVNNRVQNLVFLHQAGPEGPFGPGIYSISGSCRSLSPNLWSCEQTCL